MTSIAKPANLFHKTDLSRYWLRIVLIAFLLGLIALPLAFAASQAFAEYELYKAKDEIRARDFAAARRRLDQCLWFRPGYLDAAYLAARTARRDRDYKNAKELLTIYKAKGGIPEAQKLEEDLALAQCGQISQVERKLLAFVFEKHEDSPIVLEALAQGYMHNGRWAEATESLDALVDYWPEDYAVYVWRGWVYESLRQPNRAEKDFRQALDLRPDQDDTRLRLAEVLVLEQQYEPAGLELAILREKLPDNEMVARLTAKCYLEGNRSDEAEALLLPLLEKKPKDPSLLKELGKVALQQARWQDAEKWLRQSLSLAPRDLPANYSLNQCLHRLGKEAEAEKLKNQINDIQKDQNRLEHLLSQIAATKDSLPIRLEASRILLRNDQEPEGIKLLEGVLQEDPMNKEACALMASHYDAKGNKPLAQAYRDRSKK